MLYIYLLRNIKEMNISTIFSTDEVTEEGVGLPEIVLEAARIEVDSV